MTEGQVLDIARQALYTIILCSAPLLIISLVVGVVVSNFSDGDVHSGTDAYLRAKDYLCISWNDDIWFLDTNQSDRVYQYALVRL